MLFLLVCMPFSRILQQFSSHFHALVLVPLCDSFTAFLSSLPHSIPLLPPPLLAAVMIQLFNSPSSTLPLVLSHGLLDTFVAVLCAVLNAAVDP